MNTNKKKIEVSKEFVEFTRKLLEERIRPGSKEFMSPEYATHRRLFDEANTVLGRK